MSVAEVEIGSGVRTHEQHILAREKNEFATRRRREVVRIIALQITVFVGLLIAWWAASGTLIDSLFLSDPVSVARALYEIVIDGTLWWHLQWTLIEMFVGYVVGVSVGLGLALSTTAIPRAPQVVRPIMLGLFAIPKVALAPLIIVWFGIYLMPKIVLAASLVLFIVYFNTVAGIAEVNPRLAELLRVMGASRAALLRKLILPSAMPYIFTAMRITVPGALIGAIIGEFLSSDRGIGYLIAAASSRYDTARVFAGIISLLVFVLLLNAVVSRFQRKMSRWQPLEDPGARF